MLIGDPRIDRLVLAARAVTAMRPRHRNGPRVGPPKVVRTLVFVAAAGALAWWLLIDEPDAEPEEPDEEDGYDA